MRSSFWTDDGLTDSLALATTATPVLDTILLPLCLRRQLHAPSRQLSMKEEEKEDDDDDDAAAAAVSAAAAAVILPGF